MTYRNRHNIERFLNTQDNVVHVMIEDQHGSAPRDTGTWMLVGLSAIYNTIGGGQLEKMAIDQARLMIKDPTSPPQNMQIPLGPHIGQCCGGTVTLTLTNLDQAQRIELEKVEIDAQDDLPRIYIFGAGHVGKSLARSLSNLPLHPILVDTREEELSHAPKGVETQLAVLPEQIVRDAPTGSAFVILTHDHSLDFLITTEALLRKDAAYVGMIGSKTKRATYRNWLKREHSSDQLINTLICPIGGSALLDKRPEMIAAITTAEIIEHLEKYRLSMVENDQTLEHAKGL